ncbi:uncharacterized protein LOC111137232 [Crassostrea virginica]|uniref:Uncharacterized protein LOC111137232 n=1 Tax=Crassostrea virginica TaxID=6565 RepID=A0A8B8EWF8_CRAVI|nr:uncharacterized protein LOC111137232 [Crassostrea virginica]XP_022344324.1 uncharacterized protein LOC111137232 [Crassostrea virginica]
MGRPEEEFEVSLLTKLGTVALIISALCQLIGFASSHWIQSVSAEYGVVEYSGLWEKCDDLSIGYHEYQCAGFVWEDFQVSHWFRTIQTMESMGFVGLLATIVFIGMYMFPTPLQGKKGAKRLIIILCILCGVLITVSCIVFASLKNTLRARHMPSSTTELSWSFALSLLGGLGSIATSFLVCFG